MQSIICEVFIELFIVAWFRSWFRPKIAADSVDPALSPKRQRDVLFFFFFFFFFCLTQSRLHWDALQPFKAYNAF